jgi:hypothetical protein
MPGNIWWLVGGTRSTPSLHTKMRQRVTHSRDVLVETERAARIHRDDLAGAVTEQKAAVHRRHTRLSERQPGAIDMGSDHDRSSRPLTSS